MWNDIIAVSNDEHTINNAFCTSVLFKIVGKNVDCYPRVQSQVENKKLFVAIDKSLILLHDENTTEFNFLSFSEQIDCVSTTESGNIIVCALKDGKIHGVHINGTLLFNLSIKEYDTHRDSRGTFTQIIQIQNKFYICCKNGKLYRVHNLEEQLLMEKFPDNSFGTNETVTQYIEESVLNNVIIDRLINTSFQEEITAFCIILLGLSHDNTLNDDDFLALFATKYNLYFHSTQNTIKLRLPEDFDGVKAIYNIDHCILGLTNSGKLFEICPQVKVIFNCSDMKEYLIDELIILENSGNNIEFMILTKADANGNRQMKIIDYLSMKIKYDHPMSKNAWLVQQSKSSLNMYYLNGGNCNESNYPKEIEMSIIFETQPEQRFKRLIQQGHLEEAEEFAKQCNLSLQPIFEARAKKLIIEMNSLSERQIDQVEKKFVEFMKILQQINDENFFLELRFTEIPDRACLEKFLAYILDRINAKHINDINDLKEQQLRLDTLNVIDPYECNMEWQKFIHHSNILKICIAYFKSDILTACLIWKRHAVCVIPTLNQKSIERLLTSIPASAEPFEIIQWLKYFVPSILQIHPGTMCLLVDWSIKKARGLQYLNHWPEIGLEFATNLLTIFKDVQFLYSDVRRQYCNNIEKLQTLVNALEDLSVLKKSYNLTLTLDNYIKESFENTALHILQRVQIDQLKNIVNNFLYPIFLERGESPVAAIVKYISFLVNQRKLISLWLERAVFSINLLHNEEDKLTSALMVLKEAPVPWPETVKPLIKLGQSNSPLAKEIMIESELQTIKIIRLKYGWPANAMDNNMKLLFRILKMNLPDMSKDIKELIKASPNINSSAYFYCCYELAKKGNIDDAVAFLDDLSEKDRIDCCEKIVNIFSEMLIHPNNMEVHSDNIMEFLKLISKRIVNTDSSSILTQIQNIHELKKRFSLRATCENLDSTLDKNSLLTEGIDFILKEVRNRQENIIHYIWTSIKRLTSALDLNEFIGIIEISNRCQNIFISSALAFNVLEFIKADKNNFKYFIDLAALLIAQQMEFILNEDLTDPLAYPIAYKLLVESLKFGNVIEYEIFELLLWSGIGESLYGLTDVSIYYNNYDEADKNILQVLSNSNHRENGKDSCNGHKRNSMSIFEIVDPELHKKKIKINLQPVLECISYAMKVILRYAKDNANLKCFEKFTKMDEDVLSDINSVKDELQNKLKAVFKMKKYSIWVIIVCSISKYNFDFEILNKNHILQCYKKIFKYMLSLKNPNFIDLFSMLLSDQDSLSHLSHLNEELRNGQQKINFLMLCEMYYTHIGNMESVAKSRENRMKYFYYEELCKHDASYSEKTDNDIMTTAQLVKELRMKILSVDLLQKLSQDFNLDYQEVLVSQVLTILRSQEPIVDIKTDAFGKETISVTTTAENILRTCHPYISEITNSDLLASNLLKFIEEINFYFYELYLCVIEILSFVNEVPKEMELWKNILLFLKYKMTMRRRRKPGQLETDQWLKLKFDVGIMPKIAKYRLPFLLIINESTKNILNDEIDVENCVSWFPLIKLQMSLKGVTSFSEIVSIQDSICLLAIMNSINDYKQNDNTAEEKWNLQPVNNSFLQSVLRLIKYMKDITKILLVLYFVACNAPEGADQVEAAHECYQFALKHDQVLSTSKEKDVVKKIKQKYPIFRTEYILHAYNLVEDELMKLIENPRELINALYHHPMILLTEKPNINKIAKEVAELHNIDFDVIQMGLLQKWLALSTNSDNNELDETFCDDMNATFINPIEEIDEEFVIRSHYLLTSWEPERATELLISLMFPVSGTLNNEKRIQLFECFSNLINEKNASYTDIVNQKQYISLKCVSNLKRLGYNFSLEKFNAYDKVSILKKIWQNHTNNSSAIEVMAHICIGYEVDIPLIWNGILKQMVKLNMIKQLNALVDLLSCKANLLHIEGLVMAWQCVLLAPLKNANRTRSEEQEIILSRNLFRIQGCSISSRLDLKEIATHCLLLHRPHIAAVLIRFANKTQKNEIQQMVLKHKKDDLKKEIINLEDAGILRTVINYTLKKLEL